MSAKFFIYGSMTDRDNRTACISEIDVMSKFKEVVRVYRQRGNDVSEGDDHKWVITEPGGKTDTLWIEDTLGNVIKVSGV